jgi:hypothetical protein
MFLFVYLHILSHSFFSHFYCHNYSILNSYFIFFYSYFSYYHSISLYSITLLNSNESNHLNYATSSIILQTFIIISMMSLILIYNTFFINSPIYIYSSMVIIFIMFDIMYSKYIFMGFDMILLNYIYFNNYMADIEDYIEEVMVLISSFFLHYINSNLNLLSTYKQAVYID